MDRNRLPVVVAVSGLLVAGFGSLLTSQGNRQVGQPVWATGGVIALLGLCSFLALRWFQARPARQAIWAARLRIPSSKSQLPLVALAQFIAIVLLTLSTISFCVTADQLLGALSGSRNGWMFGYYSITSSVTTLATGLGLLLIAHIAAGVDRLSRQIDRQNEDKQHKHEAQASE